MQSAADPARTKVFGPGTLRAVAGEQASFGIQAYDEDGNKRLSGDDDFTVRIECGGAWLVCLHSLGRRPQLSYSGIFNSLNSIRRVW